MKIKLEGDVFKTAAIIAVLVVVYGGAVFWPTQQKNKALAEQVQTKQVELGSMQKPDLVPLREKIAALRAELRERSITLPEGEMDDRVLHHVSDTLLGEGITLYETAYLPTQAYKRFSATPIDVDFEGGFTRAFRVLREIEHQGPPVRIDRLVINADADDPTGQVSVNMQLKSFFLPGEAGGSR